MPSQDDVKQDDQLKQPVIILIDPQMGENIGMVARAMFNCGLVNLRIIRPRDGWPSQAAIDNSAGAVDVINDAKIYDNTKDAIKDLHYILATTGRAREMVTQVVTPYFATTSMRDKIIDGHRVGVIFGGERSGLNNDDIALADAVISIPLNPEFKSLNLAQAVLLVAHNYFMLDDDTIESNLEINDAIPATMAELDYYIESLSNNLSKGGFFKSANMRPTVMRNLRNLFQRAQLTDQEIRTLHGVIKSLKIAGAQEDKITNNNAKD